MLQRYPLIYLLMYFCWHGRFPVFCWKVLSVLLDLPENVHWYWQKYSFNVVRNVIDIFVTVQVHVRTGEGAVLLLWNAEHFLRS